MKQINLIDRRIPPSSIAPPNRLVGQNGYVSARGELVIHSQNKKPYLVKVSDVFLDKILPTDRLVAFANRSNACFAIGVLEQNGDFHVTILRSDFWTLKFGEEWEQLITVVSGWNAIEQLILLSPECWPRRSHNLPPAAIAFTFDHRAKVFGEFSDGEAALLNQVEHIIDIIDWEPLTVMDNDGHLHCVLPGIDQELKSWPPLVDAWKLSHGTYIGIDRSMGLHTNYEHRAFRDLKTLRFYNKRHSAFIDENGSVTIMNTGKIVQCKEPVFFACDDYGFLLWDGYKLNTCSEEIDLRLNELHDLRMFSSSDQRLLKPNEISMPDIPVQVIANWDDRNSLYPIIAMRWADGTVRVQTKGHSLTEVLCTSINEIVLTEHALIALK